MRLRARVERVERLRRTLLRSVVGRRAAARGHCRALLARPDILLCDDILSTLDISAQANILDLQQRLKRDSGITMLFNSHDLPVVRLVADRIAVLFRGQVMETGPTEQVFAPPHHPFTHALLQSVPRPLQLALQLALQRPLRARPALPGRMPMAVPLRPAVHGRPGRSATQPAPLGGKRRKSSACAGICP